MAGNLHNTWSLAAYYLLPATRLHAASCQPSNCMLRPPCVQHTATQRPLVLSRHASSRTDITTASQQGCGAVKQDVTRQHGSAAQTASAKLLKHTPTAAAHAGLPVLRLPFGATSALQKQSQFAQIKTVKTCTAPNLVSELPHQICQFHNCPHTTMLRCVSWSC